MAKSFISDEEMNALELQSESAQPIGQSNGFISDEEMNALEQTQKLERKKFDRPFAALGAAALSSATFAGSDVALTQLGLVKPETLKGLREHNPKATIAGEIGGIAGTLFVPGSLVARSAQVGSKVSAKVAAKLGAESASKSVAGKIAKKAAAIGAGSAVEGVFYSTGQLISESALGSPPKNAEDILSRLGLGAIIGGGFGFLFKGAGELTPIEAEKLANSAIPVLRATGQKLANLYTAISAPISGADKQGLKDLTSGAFTKEGYESTRKPVANYLAQRESEASEFSELIKQSFVSTDAIEKEYFKGIRPVERLIVNEEVNLGQAGIGAESLLLEAKQAIREMRKDRITYPKAKTDRLENETNKLQKEIQTIISGKDSFKKGPSQIYESIDEFKRTLDDSIPYDKLVHALREDSLTEIKKLRSFTMDFLENEDIWGSIASRQAAINESFSQLSQAKKQFLKHFGSTQSINGREQRAFSPKRVNAYVTKAHKASSEEEDAAIKFFIDSTNDLADAIATGKISGDRFNPKFSTLNRNPSGATLIGEQVQPQGGMVNDTLQNFTDIQKKLGNINKYRQLKWYTERPQGIDIGAIASGIVSGGLGIPTGATYAAIRSPAQAVRLLGWMEKQIYENDKFIKKSVSQFLNSGNESIGVIGKTLPFHQDFVKDLISGQDTMEEKRKQYEKNLEKYSSLTQDTQMFQQEIADKLGPLNEVAPETAAALSVKMAEALQMLSGAIPKMDDDNFLGFRPEIPPSDYEISEFANMERLIQSPLTLLDDLNNSMITIQNAAIVKGLYPEIYNQMVESVMQEVINSKVKLSYQKRLDLSVLLGRPLDLSMTPQFIQSMQQMHSPQTQQVMQQAGANNAEFSGAQFAKSKGSKNAQTPLQSSLGQ